MAMVGKYLVIQSVYMLIPLTCFYSASSLVSPQLFVSRNYFKAVAIAVLTLLVMCGLRYISEYYFFLPVFGFDNYNGHPYSISRFINNVFFYYFPGYFTYGIIYFFVTNWYKNNQRQQELQKEKAAAELTFLRSQLNPHFLFNTLNDIYSLTYQKSELAPEALLKLSELLRYMLREGNKDFMPLNQEVKYLETLIKLQEISSKGNAYINFDVEGLVARQEVASLLFVSFVENAFKHGILDDPGNPVKIHLSAANDNITFSVSNKKNHHQKDKTDGIGLNNVRRRLELIYPEKHKLEISDEDKSYHVNLTLQTGV